MKRFALMAVALMGCAEKQSPAPVVTPRPDGPVVATPEDGCGAGKIGDLVGKSMAATMEANIRKRSGARTIRVLPPGAMATMDFRPDRLNIDVDDKGIVTSLRCG